MASPVDVGSLPNHVKYCVSVLYLLRANIRTSPVGIPYSTYVPYKYLVLSSGIYPASNTVSTNMKIITCIRKNKTRKFLAK